MMNRKGVGSALSTVVKIIVILIIFIVLISTFIGLFGRTKKATLDLIKKEYDQFIYLDGSYIHPDLLDSDLSTFWFIGFKSFIREAVTSKEPCLGSFYIDDRINTQGVSISFLQTSTGITMFLRDNKGVVGAYDDKIFNNTDGHEWKLCIIDPSRTNFNAFFHEFELSFRLGHPLHVASQKGTSWITDLHDVVIDFKGKPKGSDIKAIYFTPAVLDNPDMPPNEADYHAYLIGDVGKIFGIKPAKWLDWTVKDRIDRYLFFFVVHGDKFCILPTTREKGETKALNLVKVRDLLTKNVFEGRAKEEPEEFFRSIDQPQYQTFCKIPGGEESEEISIFKGHNSCYYYGCLDINKIKADQCDDVFGKCPGLCTPWRDALIPPGKCKSCQDIKKCRNYEDYRLIYNACNLDLCQLGCIYDITEKECIIE